MDEMKPTPELMNQVVAQCNVVVHLATVLAQVHADYAKIFSAGGKGPEDILDIVGKRTASLMEELGDMLNGMDAVSEEDDWTHPVFIEAQRLWPTDAALSRATASSQAPRDEIHEMHMQTFAKPAS